MSIKEFLIDFIRTDDDCVNAKIQTIEEFFNECGGDYDFVVSGDFDTKTVGMKFGEVLVGYEMNRYGNIDLDSLCFLEPYKVEVTKYKKNYNVEKD